MTQEQFQSFTTWAELIDHVRAGYRLWYQAPLDYRPAAVSVALRKHDKVRVYPANWDVDAFTAGSEHLDRFRRLVKQESK